MMKHIIKSISCALLAGGLLFSSCIGQYDKWNIDPNEVTEDGMGHDNLKVGAYFTQMQKGVFIVGETMGGEYQCVEMMVGDAFAGYLANINTFSYTTYHNDHYVLYYPWYNAAFADAYKNVMQPWKAISDYADENSPALAMATIVKVLCMNRVTDMFGPIPYSKFGTSIQVAYDRQKDVYDQFFVELDNAINILTTYTEGNKAKVMEEYDHVYQGDVNNWIKLANSLRLRLAMRISYKDKSKATEEAAAAINHSHGLMSSADDSAILHQGGTLVFVNPLYEVSQSFEDVRMGATMDCYMNGYADPRLKRYFRPAANDAAYHGVQNGLSDLDKDAYVAAASGLNFDSKDDMLWMHASESYFLLAEAKLRLKLGDETVQSYYEKGIRTSFAEKGASGVDAYIENNKSLPLTKFTDPVTNNDVDVSKYISKRTVAWNDKGNEEEKMERIMIQKWISLYPNGQEAWSEMRRTGYPGFVRIASYNRQTEVGKDQLISRLKFPTTEYSNNTQNTQDAVSLLGGSDIAGTRLWWDVKRK